MATVNFTTQRNARALSLVSRIAVAASLLVTVALTGQALASETSGSKLLSVTFAPRPVNKVEIGDFHFLPGQPAPVHTHTAPVFGYVSKGAIYYQVAGQKPHLLKAGDAFYEPVGPQILHFDNASKTEEAVFTDFNLQREGEPFIVFPTPPTAKIDRRSFPTAVLDGTTVSKVTVFAQTLKPSASSGEQTPTETTLYYVAAGEVRLQVEGEEPVLYHVGQTFFAPKNKTVQELLNTSPTKNVKLIVFHLLNPQGAK